MKALFIFLLSAPIFTASVAHADPSIWMPDYFEDADFPFHKHFGTTTKSFRNRIYHENNSSVPNANWVMDETGGEDGSFFGQESTGNVTFTSTPYLPSFVWYMNTSSDGSVREVADHFFDENGPTCYVTMPTLQSITWSPPGLHQVGDSSTNTVSLSGTCGSNTGTSQWTILDYYPSFTIPAVTSSHGWSCPAATFPDVIKIRQVQTFGSTVDDVVYWYAKHFGAIKLWNDNGYIIRRICDSNNPSNCQCAENWMAGFPSGGGGSGGGEEEPECGGHSSSTMCP